MAAFQRLAHDLGVAYAFERIIGPAVGQFDNVIDHIVDIFGVDEMRHAELARQRLALGVEVDPDDFVGAHHLGALDDVKADAAQAENHDIGAGLDLGGENNRPHPGGYDAPYVANLVERGNVTDFRHGDFGYDDVIGKRGCTQVVMNRLATHIETHRAVEIGNASWRERGWPEVEISGGGGALK